jgi:hypothetical protein
MTDPVWDVVFGVHGFRAILLAHKLKVFPLLANRPHLFEKRMDELARQFVETHDELVKA